MKPKRWSRTAFREKLKTKFAHVLAGEEGISLREARRDLDGISREQLEDIYESVAERVCGEDEASDFTSVVNEVKVHDLLPTLASNAQRRRQ
ncbi:MAG: hypothetical protein ACM3ZB_17485 [bacterium]|jgi:hypothetical protein